MSDESRRERRPPMMPEEFRPATVFDYVMFAVTFVVALAMTAPLTIAAWRTWSPSGPSMTAVYTAAWNFGVWMLPLLRVMLNWRSAVLGGVQNHSYLVRKFWHVQIVIVLAATMLLVSFAVLLKVLCAPFGIFGEAMA
ncbi:MAG TPA: hypothetical protein VM165_01540 [Planctomycetaceae bacterium]|nr:hypothetical protein [Planctomycetaceae bacterium]